MRKLVFCLLAVLCLSGSAKDTEVRLKWVHTSDVHGSLFGYNYLTNKTEDTGLSAVWAYTTHLRDSLGDALVLTDGGDVLQGQPTAYYSNYVDTISPHLVASVMNQMGYVAAAIGNHDIETGHAVYDRWLDQCQFPVVGANVIDERTGEPYLKPYVVVERLGVKIAILGMLTPGIPNWLPRTLWSGLHFDDILSSARKWVEIIKEREHPDMLVGLFHSGFNGGIQTSDYLENATEQVAHEVPQFDLICYGHDHNPQANVVVRADGSVCPTMGPTNAARKVAEADITLKLKKGKVVEKHVEAHIVDVSGGQSAEAKSFEAKFQKERDVLAQWVEQVIGTNNKTIRERDAFFGSSEFVDLIHQMQLQLTGADVSFAAPLSFDSRIDSGAVHVRDMFALYKYENFLYTMRLSGKEIKDYLEYSYGWWTNQMKSPADHLLLLEDKTGNVVRRKGLKQLYYNLDSAAGIDYTVDVTKPKGERITIMGMSDGRPFEMDADYRVAINSYRGNGGGGLLTEGAGIAPDNLSQRVLTSTEKDLRFYLMQKIIADGGIQPRKLDNWRFVPEEWTEQAALRDRQLLFPE